jgi:hypothetical protein
MPGYKRNQYGTSVGGPIKRNKTFFFGNFEGARIRQGITKVATEPTTPMKNGDFSAVPTVIYDPASLGLNGAGTRAPFPGNIIPAARITAAGTAVANLFPAPNGPGASGANGLFTSSPTKTDDFDQFTVRVDHRFNDNNTLQLQQGEPVRYLRFLLRERQQRARFRLQHAERRTAGGGGLHPPAGAE